MRTLLVVMIVGLCTSAAFGAQSPAPTNQPSQPPPYQLEPVATENAAYPAPARDKKVEGEATATFLVSETGDVSHVHVLKGDPLLAEAAETAVNR